MASSTRSLRYNYRLKLIYFRFNRYYCYTGHSNAKLLITHGGMLGTQEAIYHAVPLIGLPFCNDQHLNIVMAIKQGFGLKVDWNSLNEKLMHDTIVRIVNEPRYNTNI